MSSRQDYGVDLLGPTRSDYHWQAKAGQGFEAKEFKVDWEAKRAILSCRPDQQQLDAGLRPS